MTQVTGALIDLMVRAVVDEIDPEQVILFRYRGRGDEHQDSDVGLLVVMNSDEGKGTSCEVSGVRRSDM